ncbi:MAG: D-aminoacyl-tRNA deacylase, partial [Candidatus Heimdallarchaeaceae archaeon]
EEFKVDLEVTHHGPTELETPLVFMELGSNEEYWEHEKGAMAVGEAILETAEGFINQTNYSGSSYIGFGGNHYAYRFHKHLMENPEISISHIAPKHALDAITPEIVQEAFAKTIENPAGAFIDKKGARSEQRRIITEIVEGLGKECILI